MKGEEEEVVCLPCKPMQNVKTRSSISTRVVIRTVSARWSFVLEIIETCDGGEDGSDDTADGSGDGVSGSAEGKDGDVSWAIGDSSVSPVLWAGASLKVDSESDMANICERRGRGGPE